jgi:hypothetical protein
MDRVASTGVAAGWLGREHKVCMYTSVALCLAMRAFISYTWIQLHTLKPLFMSNNNYLIPFNNVQSRAYTLTLLHL